MNTKANDGNDYVRARREQGRYDKALGLIYELKERRKRAMGK